MKVHSNQMYPLSMDSKKIFCAYHQSEFLTNFCQQSNTYIHHSEQCLMPLCPSCIAQHTQQHFSQGKKPTYTNINEAINRAKQSCYCTIITLQEYKKLNHDIYEYISALQENIHFQLINKRNQLFDIITQIFNDYQSRLIKQIYENYQEKNVYLIEESVNASKFIDDQITNLYQKISLLKGDDCLSSLITYYAVDQQNYKESLEEFDEYFQKNRKAGKIQISILDEALKKLTTNLCDNLLSVECIIQNFESKPQQPLDQQGVKSKRYGFNKNQTNQTIKISRKTVAQKQNQQNLTRTQKQSLMNSRRSKQKIGVISRQQKEVSFNEQNTLNSRPPLPVIRTTNDSMSSQSIVKRKSMRQSQIMIDQDSKRFTRNFKRLQV